jgi:beta-glucosidase/6-phospho-beta-glucosidase/beta-galactosidase
MLRALETRLDLRDCFLVTPGVEWTKGYSKRSGIIHVDFQTPLKSSTDFYLQVIATTGGVLRA